MFNPAELTLRKALIAWVSMALVLLGGYLSYERLGRFEDPEFLIRQAVIVTRYPGATPTEVAAEVTDRIEEAVQQLQEVKKITSISWAGRSQVNVEVRLDAASSAAALDQVWDGLRAKMDEITPSLPPGATAPFVNGDFGDVYALFLAVTGSGYTASQRWDYVDLLRRELALVQGVGQVALLGAPEEAIYVEVSRTRAGQLGVPLDKVYGALGAHNVVHPAGEVPAEALRLKVQPEGLATSVADLSTLVVAGDGRNGLVRLGDIATISREEVEPPSMLMRYDGEPVIGLGVAGVAGGNVVKMGEAVRQRLAELEGQRPVGMEVHTLSDQPTAVKVSVDGFVANLMAAVVIVVLVLLVFMGLRSGLIIGVTLVLTVAGTLILMLFNDIAMQRVSLGALIIALGMLVDNAIVVTDGILVRMQRGMVAARAASEVVGATLWPLFGGTVVGILAFSAIGLSPTDMGEYAGSLFWVILYSMLLSWLFAVTLTPLLCVALLRPSRAGLAASDPVSVPPSVWVRRYQSFLAGVVHYRWLSLTVVVAIFAFGVVLFGQVKAGFMPDSARPQFVVDLQLPEGTDIAHTSSVVAAAEARVRAHPEVTHISSMVGRGGLRFMLTYSPADPSPSYGQLLVDVADFRVIPGLVTTLQTELEAALPMAEVKVWKFMLGRGGGKKIEAAFRGPDPAVLRRLADEAKAIMAEDPEAIAIQDDWRQPVPVLRPRIDGEAAQRAGILPADISAALARALEGERIGVYREGERLIPIIARAPADERAGAEELGNVTVFSPVAGVQVPVRQFIESVETRWEDAIIRRENRFPMIKAQCDPPAGALSAPLFERLRPRIEAIERPPGYQLEWHGEYKASTEANEGLVKAAPFGFAAMVLTVLIMFNGLRQTAVIWLTVPLAVVGVAIGLVLLQAPFEFMAILGFLSLTGMMIKNAIVLVDETDREIACGRSGMEAILSAASSRARPVILGAATTVLGVAPLLGDPFFRSMAVTIMFGLIFATLLTLVVIPLLYATLFGIRAERKAEAEDPAEAITEVEDDGAVQPTSA